MGTTPTCYECEEKVAIPFKCKLCGNSYCSRHRLPENHNCTEIGHYNSAEYKSAKARGVYSTLKETAQPEKTSPIFQFPKRGTPRTSSTSTGGGRHFRNAAMTQFENRFYERALLSHPDVISFGRESVDLLVAFILITFAVSFNRLVSGTYTGEDVLILAIALAPAFILHELGHKYMAVYLGRFARFTLFKRLTLITLLMGLLPFFIGTPGTTIIQGEEMNKQELGVTALAGPMVNLVLALGGLLVLPFIPSGIFYTATLMIVTINLILGIFNLIPVWVLDGKKIFNWSKGVYGLTLVTFIALLVFQVSIFGLPY